LRGAAFPRATVFRPKVTVVGGKADPVVTADPVLVVYPDSGSIASRTLARRLCAAASLLLADHSAEARLEPVSALGQLDPDWLRTVTALVVGRTGCAPPGPVPLEVLRGARRRIAVVGDHDEADWPAFLSGSDLEVDAILEVGSAPREHDHRGVPRRFLYNGSSAAEAELIRSQVAGGRPLPWALVGHATPARAVLADALVEHFGSDGIVFLPSDRPVRGGGRMLGEQALGRLLSATSYFVWCSSRRPAHHESHRFLEAVLAGAVPCKIEPRHLATGAEMPGVYRSVRELVESAHERGPEALYEDARQYHLARGTLEDLLAEALVGVCEAPGRLRTGSLA
jgi:hypothetical protein